MTIETLTLHASKTDCLDCTERAGERGPENLCRECFERQEACVDIHCAIRHAIAVGVPVADLVYELTQGLVLAQGLTADMLMFPDDDAEPAPEAA